MMATICKIAKEPGKKITEGDTVQLVGEPGSPWKYFGIKAEVRQSALKAQGKVVRRIGPLCAVHWYSRERPSTSSQYVTGISKRPIRAGSPVVEIRLRDGSYFVRKARFYEKPIGLTLMRCRPIKKNGYKLYEVEVMFGGFDTQIPTKQIS